MMTLFSVNSIFFNPTAIDVDYLKRVTLDNDKRKSRGHFGGTAKGGKASKMFGGMVGIIYK